MARSETGHSEERSETGHSESQWYAQMAAFPLPACDAAVLQRRLAERDEYRVEVPIIEWGGRQLVRASVQGYNTHEDIGALVGALADLLPKVS